MLKFLSAYISAHSILYLEICSMYFFYVVTEYTFAGFIICELM